MRIPASGWAPHRSQAEALCHPSLSGQNSIYCDYFPLTYYLLCLILLSQKMLPIKLLCLSSRFRDGGTSDVRIFTWFVYWHQAGIIMAFLVASISLESSWQAQICRLILKCKAQIEGTVDHAEVIEEDIFNFLDNLYDPKGIKHIRRMIETKQSTSLNKHQLQQLL